MHFHHRHDIGGCTDSHDEWPDFARTILATLDRRDIQLMSALQDSIDALTAQLAAAAADVTAKLDDVENQLAAQAAEPQVDLSALQAAVAQVQALVPAPAADPTPAPVVDQPADPAPADPQPQPVDDGTVPAQSIPSVPLA